MDEDYTPGDYEGDDTLEDDGVTVEQIAFVYGIDLSDYMRDHE